MYNSAIDILKKINENGFSSYIIGGYVRDKLLNISSNDIDICTSATPMDLKNIFKDNITSDNYGSSIIKLNDYKFEITTFRKELEYKNNRIPSKIIYIDNLYEDLLRRDFTINTICIDSNNNIVDLLSALKDIDKKIIKCVGNPNIKLKEDSLRILRAIRFSAKLNFKLDKNLYKAIINNAYLLKNLSYTRKKEELNEILKYKKGIKLLKKTKIYKYLDIDINNIKYTNNVLGIWSQINAFNYPFTKHERNIINKINELKNKKLDNYILYSNDLDILIIIAEIKKLNKNKLIKRYNNLPIHNKSDININISDINSNKIKDIIKDIEIKILNKKLNNNYDDIKNYINKHYL